MIKNVCLILVMTTVLTGCATIAEKTNMLSDEDILSQTSGVLGYLPDEITILNRRTAGPNTYVNVMGKKDKKRFTCVINGGDLLSFGMVNPPMCAKTGQPININSANNSRSTAFKLPFALLMGR